MSTPTATAPGPDGLLFQQLFWPQPLLAGPALSLLRHWAAQTHAPQLILEARSDVTGVSYLVGSQRRHAAAVKRAVEQLVSGAIVIGAESADRPVLTTARRLQLSTTNRPLEPADAAASERAVLAALTAVGRGESLSLQVVLGPRRAPRLGPRELTRSDQSTASKLLHGLLPDQRPDARQALTRKLGQHGFAATVRLGVDAIGPNRRRTLLLGLAAAIGTIETPGVRLQLRREKVDRLNRPKSQWSALLPSQHLSVSEVSALSAWPITGSDREPPLPGQPPRHPRPVPPTPALTTGARVVAEASAPGSGAAALGYDVEDALRHSWILGPNGVGKSTLLLNLITQDLAAGRPVVVIEPKDLITDVLARIPAERQADVVLLDPLSDRPVGINPLARRDDRRSPELVADSLFATFAALHGDSLGPRSADILRQCLVALAQRDDASLAMLPLLLSNPGVRRSLTQSAVRADPFTAGPFWQWFDSLSPEALSTVVAPLSNKLRPLLTPQLRRVLAQRQPRFNVRDVLTDNKVLLVPLQKGVVGPETAQLLAAVVLAELWQAIRERAAAPESSRTPVMVYVDEVQDYLRLPTDLADALATARSLGAGFHLAHQYEKQLPPAMLEAVRSNARSRVCFQLPAGDARSQAAGQSVLSPEDFGALPAHHVYLSLIRRNAVQPWASGLTRPAPLRTSDPAVIRRLSEQRYGQPLDEIEAGFAALLDVTRTDDTADIGAPTRRQRPS